MEHFLDGIKEVSVYLITAVISYIGLEIRRCAKSISELNVNIAEILQKLTYHEKELDKHDKRLEHLEEKV